MKRVPLTISICILAAVLTPKPAYAAPMACSTFSNYSGLVAAGSCTIDSGATQLLFSGFTFTPFATGTGITPVDMSVSVLDNVPATPPSSDRIYGFLFGPSVSVAGVGSEDIHISYTVTAQSAIISSLHLLVNESTAGAGATATVQESDVCSPPATPCTLFAGSTPPTTGFHQDLEGIGPYSSIFVDKDINVTSTTAGGFAAISGVRDAVDLSISSASPVPEPATASYLAASIGALALGWLRRKSRRADRRIRS